MWQAARELLGQPGYACRRMVVPREFVDTEQEERSMSKVRVLVTVAVVAIAGFAWVSASQSRSVTPGTLSGLDYEQIKELYARYNQGSDFRDAELFLSAFADDAVMTRGGRDIVGMAALRAERVERYADRPATPGDAITTAASSLRRQPRARWHAPTTCCLTSPAGRRRWSPLGTTRTSSRGHRTAGASSIGRSMAMAPLGEARSSLCHIHRWPRPARFARARS